MAIYLKEFENHTQYENYINGSDSILPNVSVCLDQPTVVHYNPYVEPPTPIETRLVCKYNVTDTSSETQLCYDVNFSAMEIDGVEQSELVIGYRFSTTGEHTVKYTLTDPTFIEVQTFMDCSSLTSIVIPNSVTSIGYGVFQSCSGLTSCTIGSSVTSIGESAFRGCSSLTSIDIPSGVTSIGYNAFESCYSLTSIDIPSGVTSIDSYTFSQCSSLTSITIPDSVTSIGWGAFCSCSSLDATSIAAIEAINPDNAFYCD